MTPLCAILLFFLTHPLIAFSAEPPRPDSPDSDNAAAWREANRVLEEEIKLAARPQPYLVVDLLSGVILIKGRGVELHRLPVPQYRTTDERRMKGLFYLTARPPIVRRKAVPTDNPDQEPISLKDMPVAFDLHFHPPLAIHILPPARESPFQWFIAMGAAWWTSLRDWSASILTGNSVSAPPTIRVTLGTDQAQSLAWTVTEGMPLLIRRTTDKE